MKRTWEMSNDIPPGGNRGCGRRRNVLNVCLLPVAKGAGPTNLIHVVPTCIITTKKVDGHLSSTLKMS
jgi:hypothetical protein